MDILIGILLLAVVSFLALFIGARGTRRLTHRGANFLVLVLVVVLAVDSLLFQDSLLLARLFPFSGVVVFGSGQLPLIALLAGTVSTHLSGPRSSQLGVAGGLLLFGVILAMLPFLGAPPTGLTESWSHGVALQSSESSCSAASAATLLRQYGLTATEGEMAPLCFTRGGGTSMLGVYRGLCLKTAGTSWRVEVLSRASVADLRRAVAAGPVLLTVGLDRFPLRRVDPRYEEDWGWVPGLRHAVVLFRFLPEGRIEMGDPAEGRELWNVKALDDLWRGEGIRLVRR
jgi:hypothetical protein